MSVETFTTEVVLDDGGESLRFRIRPFSATKGEAWLLRALLALAKAGDKLPKDLDIDSIAKVLFSPQIIPVLGSLDYAEAEPLLDDLLTCCTRVLDGNVTQDVTRSTVDGYIRSPLTLMRLRIEALKANFGFLFDGARSNYPQSPESAPGGATGRRMARPTPTSRP